MRCADRSEHLLSRLRFRLFGPNHLWHENQSGHWPLALPTTSVLSQCRWICLLHVMPEPQHLIIPRDLRVSVGWSGDPPGLPRSRGNASRYGWEMRTSRRFRVLLQLRGVARRGSNRNAIASCTDADTVPFSLSRVLSILGPRSFCVCARGSSCTLHIDSYLWRNHRPHTGKRRS